MLPSRHIMVSLPLSATVVVVGQSWLAGILCFLSGLLLDLDHPLEYLINRKAKFPHPKHLYQACKQLAKLSHDTQKLYLLFHALEFAVLFWLAFLFSNNIYILAIAIGYTGHILLDVTGNVNLLKPQAYFMSARIKNRFRLISVLKNH